MSSKWVIRTTSIDGPYNRDRRFDDSRSSHYVSRDVVGADDLDDYGDWQPNPEYGNVWYPRVEAGWAPYHTGHWAWIDPWGWTWVDDSPWGYAPFPLRPLGFCRQSLGMGPGSDDGGSCVCSSSCCLRGRRPRIRRQCWLVPARSSRSLCPFLRGQPRLRESREHQQHHSQPDRSHQRLQHDDRQQDHRHQQRDLCEPRGFRGRDGRAARLLRGGTVGFTSSR